MKRRYLYVVVPALIVVLFSFVIFEKQHDNVGRNQLLSDIMFKVLLNRAHYQPQEIDDNLSEKAFKLYLKQLDINKRFFIKSDIDVLLAYQNKIDDDIMKGGNELYTKAMDVLTQRIDEAQTYYQEILDQPFDYSKKEGLELDPDKREYVESTNALKEEWRKFLKYEALVRYHNKIEAQEATKEGEKSEEKPKTKSPEELEVEVRSELLRAYNNRFDYLKKLDEEDRYSEYLNAILSVYGPHTEYFPPQRKETFDMQMSGRLEGIGAQLSMQDGNIKVVHIVPGSASWRQKQLKAEDLILKVGQGEEEAVSVVGMSLKNAVKLIRGPKGTEVRLTVKKPDGRIMVIPIIRDVVIFEESYAKSAIIENNKSGKKYGYIYLPEFYADFNGTGGRSSSEDVKKELIKLKEKGVESVILDLRNNGGGSLQDVVKMSGYFIEEGPVVQVQDRRGEPTILSDTDPSVTWDGPLVVMINEASASASEILAAAMQDYNRALVVGSNSFGKGTVQRFLELDHYVNPNYSQYKPLGSLKLTIQKFYRINGGATQEQGVSPDIQFPDSYMYLKIGEKELDYAMPWDEIASASYEKWELPASLKAKLADRSKQRVEGNHIFNLIEQNAKRLQKQRENTFQSLSYADFKKEQDNLKEEAEKFKNLSENSETLKFTSLQTIGMETRLDSIRSASEADWLDQLEKDIYVQEVTSIFDDWKQY
ncbi:carboxy terminal-processing peptidase [Rapidithrix thailandica]|uniref:Carboxy terminal-processing peptidase n=1 Tax=Rapidithrix thailandica TaxID=413964 RepID=A0AAW9SEF1_9BACT